MQRTQTTGIVNLAREKGFAVTWMHPSQVADQTME